MYQSCHLRQAGAFRTAPVTALNKSGMIASPSSINLHHISLPELIKDLP
jgi:hypothetical protein